MTRTVLPNRRAAETITFEHMGMNFTVTYGRLKDDYRVLETNIIDGPVVEMFLNNEHLNSLADSTARDAAIAISIGLQHGVSLETLRGAMTRNSDGSPSSPIGRALDLIR